MKTIKNTVSAMVAKARNNSSKCLSVCYALTAVLFVTLCASPALCTGGGVDINATFTQIMSILYDIAKYMGIGIVAYAVFSWVLAMKDDNADGQSRAIRFLVVGLVLAGIGSFVAPIVNSLLGI